MTLIIFLGESIEQSHNQLMTLRLLLPRKLHKKKSVYIKNYNKYTLHLYLMY